jgi:DNA-binding beta-propeller fold protein YncE
MFQQRSLAGLVTVLIAGGLALAGCSGSGTLPSGAAPSLQSPSLLQSLGRREMGSSALYVSDWYGKSVFRFVRNADGSLMTPAGSSLVLGYNPGPIAIGANGSLFVTDEDAESLFVYGKGASGYDQPKRELALPFVPDCVAADSAGHEFVGGFTNGFVAVYAPGAKGNAGTLQRIALPDGHPDVNGVAVDDAGNLYVSDTNEISEFTTPVTNPTLARAIVGTGQQNAPTGLAVSSKSGELYAANAGDNNILGYSSTANGKSRPNRTISSSNPQLKGPLGVALAGSVLYSTSGTTLNGPPSVFVFDALKARQAPKQVVTGSYLALPIGAAIGP